MGVVAEDLAVVKSHRPIVRDAAAVVACRVSTDRAVRQRQIRPTKIENAATTVCRASATGDRQPIERRRALVLISNTRLKPLPLMVSGGIWAVDRQAIVRDQSWPVVRFMVAGWLNDTNSMVFAPFTALAAWIAGAERAWRYRSR